jgi:hypothetical protein
MRIIRGHFLFFGTKRRGLREQGADELGYAVHHAGSSNTPIRRNWAWNQVCHGQEFRRAQSRLMDSATRNSFKNEEDRLMYAGLGSIPILD